MDPRPSRYTPTAVALHWIVAVLIIGNLAFGLYVAGLPVSPAKLRTVSWHKWVGITILLTVAIRLAWRLRHPVPALPATMAPWERRAANGTHILLYVLFFAAPLTVVGLASLLVAARATFDMHGAAAPAPSLTLAS